MLAQLATHLVENDSFTKNMKKKEFQMEKMLKYNK